MDDLFPAAARGLARRPAGLLTRTLVALVALIAGLIVIVPIAPASAAPDPSHITLTLEGCKGDAGDFPAAGPFVCPDAGYTTGNLGQGWNELDLVPHG